MSTTASSEGLKGCAAGTAPLAGTDDVKSIEPRDVRIASVARSITGSRSRADSRGSIGRFRSDSTASGDYRANSRGSQRVFADSPGAYEDGSPYKEILLGYSGDGHPMSCSFNTWEAAQLLRESAEAGNVIAQCKLDAMKEGSEAKRLEFEWRLERDRAASEASAKARLKAEEEYSHAEGSPSNLVESEWELFMMEDMGAALADGSI